MSADGSSGVLQEFLQLRALGPAEPVLPSQAPLCEQTSLSAGIKVVTLRHVTLLYIHTEMEIRQFKRGPL